MKKVTYHDIAATFPEEKKSVESIYGRIVPVRKISYWFTLPLLTMNISAFQASVISLFIAVVACIFISYPNNTIRIIGVCLVPIWHIFDCVDGNIARYNKTVTDFGSAVDAICGYFIFAFLPLSLGIAAYNIQLEYFGIPSSVFIIIGALASVCDILTRLIHQKYAFQALMIESKTEKHFEKGDNQYTLKGFHHLRKMADVEMGIVGIPMFFLWLCPFFNLYYLLVTYYCLFKVAALIVGTGYYLYKCHEGH